MEGHGNFGKNFEHFLIEPLLIQKIVRIFLMIESCFS